MQPWHMARLTLGEIEELVEVLQAESRARARADRKSKKGPRPGRR